MIAPSNSGSNLKQYLFTGYNNLCFYAAFAYTSFHVTTYRPITTCTLYSADSFETKSDSRTLEKSYFPPDFLSIASETTSKPSIMGSLK